MQTGELDLKHFNISELQAFFDQITNHYYYWAIRLAKRLQNRDNTLKKLEFPYPDYRKGQRIMAVDICHTVRDKEHLLMQAPTGIGKTMAALFPAYKALGMGLTDRIFYFTARTTGKLIARDTTEILINNAIDIRALILTSKQSICFNPDSACHPDDCKYAKGFYDRLPKAIDAVFDLKLYDRKTIEEFSRKFMICTFEFSLEIALWCDCIICDYNYAFDPRVYLKRFFDSPAENYTFLIDDRFFTLKYKKLLPTWWNI